MASRYNITNKATFNPFSFEEYLKPVVAYSTAYLDIEKQYLDLSDSSAVLQQAALQDLGAEWVNKFNAYNNELNSYVDLLYSLGITPTTRSSVSKLRRNFANNMTPIIAALAKKQQEIERQNKLQDASKGSMVFSRDARTTSLDDYLKGTEGFQEVDLNEVLKEGLTGATAISSRYFNTTEGQMFRGQYLNMISQQGYSPELAADILSRKTDANGNPLYPEFDKYISDTMSKYKAFEGTKEGDAIYSSLMLGINTGIMYKETNDLKENWRQKMQELAAKELAVAREKYNIETSNKPTDENIGYLSYIPIPNVQGLKSNRTEREKARKFIEDWEKDKTGKFLDKDTSKIATANPLGGTGMQSTYGDTRGFNYKDYWNQLSKKYGTKKHQEILEKLRQEEINEVKMYQKYYPNVTDYSNIIDIVKLGATSPNANIQTIENGKIEPKIFLDAIKYNAVPYYDGQLNSWVIRGTDENNNITEFKVSPDIMNSMMVTLKTGEYKNAILVYLDLIDEYNKIGDFKSAQDLIGEMIYGGIIAPSNSRIEILGKTTTDKKTLSNLLGIYGRQ